MWNVNFIAYRANEVISAYICIQFTVHPWGEAPRRYNSGFLRLYFQLYVVHIASKAFLPQQYLLFFLFRTPSPLFLWLFYVGDSVADPGCPGSGSASKTFIFLTQKTDTKFSKIRSGMFVLDTGSCIFFHPGSRGQKGTGSRIRSGGRERIRKWRKKCLVYWPKEINLTISILTIFQVQEFLWWVTCELELPIFTPSVKYLLNGYYKCSPTPITNYRKIMYWFNYI